MKNFPEPVKPTSSMESLQPYQLGSTQSYLWEPGDHLTNQEVFQKSLAAPEPIGSGGSLKNSLNQTGAIYGKIGQSFGLIYSKPQPEDIQTKPRPSEDIMHEPEEFYEHDLSTFQTIKKVPWKLSYPLKPSRFKKYQILYLEPKSHKRLQRLVFDFLLSFDLSPFLFVLER
ncbi:hypothetical protein IGI04_014801 [Brassica rapa subsp. trilocularis]|uniref:Uncharacterized protein n=1 Tax=Brassica rapa subsp. trilocularis TaxID=1813537 RepID=A0ABQ7MN82_BRACM|nr:hypothetical protein IGI04_014801 [Brassica rapa subsp. trilocularis]